LGRVGPCLCSNFLTEAPGQYTGVVGGGVGGGMAAPGGGMVRPGMMMPPGMPTLGGLPNQPQPNRSSKSARQSAISYSALNLS